jgi:hypothetical protein
MGMGVYSIVWKRCFDGAESLTFKGKNPVVKLIDKVYRNGVKLTQEAMAELEKQINRLPHLPKWFVEIPYQLT